MRFLWRFILLNGSITQCCCVTNFITLRLAPIPLCSPKVLLAIVQSISFIMHNSNFNLQRRCSLKSVKVILGISPGGVCNRQENSYKFTINTVNAFISMLGKPHKIPLQNILLYLVILLGGYFSNLFSAFCVFIAVDSTVEFAFFAFLSNLFYLYACVTHGFSNL